MISPIKILPGELIHEEFNNTGSQCDLLIISLVLNCEKLWIRYKPQKTMYGAEYIEYNRYDTIFNSHISKHTRKGFIFKKNELNIFDSEDFLCHDGRCFPSSIGGCKLCQYSDRGKTKRNFYYPGDEVWVPEFKKRTVIREVSIGLDFKGIEDIFEKSRNGYCLYLGRNSSFIPDTDSKLTVFANAINNFNLRNRLSLYYRLDGIGGFYKASELGIIKRKHYLIDFEQLEFICEICLYGKESPECEKCGTALYKKSIKNDIQRDYREI